VRDLYGRVCLRYLHQLGSVGVRARDDAYISALAASRLQAAVLYKLDRDAYVRTRDEYYEEQPEGWQAAVPRLQAAARSKLVR